LLLICYIKILILKQYIYLIFTNEPSMTSLSIVMEISFSIPMIDKLLNLFYNIDDDLNHVFILHIAEKLHSHVDELMGRVSATRIS